MKLAELAPQYQAQAEVLRSRIKELEALRAAGGSTLELDRRIRLLETMRREASALAKLCAHYYERGYCRNARYTVRGIKRYARTTL